ncbi:hypothetical protein [Thermodesulfovibrio sp.]|uniref:hypothetical protein n=1 Tax=Thermodesulfovibrio sp. TaxID=2067987 RepID=UPI0030AAABCB
MGKFILVKYGNKYPEDKKPFIEEIAGHFDVRNIKPKYNYSLHTEYSITKREFNSIHLKDCDEIKRANYKGIPKLWFNEKWAKEFVKFIKNLTSGKKPPTIIEIHPPYRDYSGSIDNFLDIYKIFEEEILEIFSNAQIVFENRYKTYYTPSQFLISKINDLENLIEGLEKRKFLLSVVLDIPQLFSAHNIGLEESKIIALLDKIKELRDYIIGIHMWGKTKKPGGGVAAHTGDLNSFFQFNSEIKNLFLQKLKEAFDDPKERYLVLEVNSGLPDFLSIYNDFLSAGFNFE